MNSDKGLIFPAHWKDFLHNHDLAMREIEIPSEHDLSNMGADLKSCDESMAREETEEFYPGIADAKLGFVAVALCMEGSGDPYFIRTFDGEGGPLYRVYHDSVSDSDFDFNSAVEIVLQDSRDLVKFKK